MPIVRMLFACALHAAVACASADPTPAQQGHGLYGVDVTPELRGAADRGRDPAVVALLREDHVPCTGALVAPDVVLTARSCLAADGADPCDPTRLAPARVLDVWTGEDLDHAALVGHGRDVVAPDAAGCDADVALVLLDGDVPGIHTLSFRAHGPSTGEHLRAVGFASTAKVLRDHVAINEVAARAFTLGEACAGLGHVALDEDTGEVVGVSSAAPCEASPSYVRADAFTRVIQAALARSGEGELLRKLAAKDAGADAAVKARKLSKSERPDKDLGAACATGEDCAAGACARVRAGRYCVRRCGLNDRCPTAWRCVNAEDERAGPNPDGGPYRTTPACVRSSD